MVTTQTNRVTGCRFWAARQILLRRVGDQCRSVDDTAQALEEQRPQEVTRRASTGKEPPFVGVRDYFLQ
nr:hypothetical protein [Pseudomonas sp. NFACC19-2]